MVRGWTLGQKHKILLCTPPPPLSPLGVSPQHNHRFLKKTSSNQWLCGGDSTQQNFGQDGSAPRSNLLPFYIPFFNERV